MTRVTSVSFPKSRNFKTEYLTLFFSFPCLLQLAYLSSGFMYAKACNLVLFFRADPRMGLVYLLLFVLQV